MIPSPTREEQRLTLSNEDLPNSGRSKVPTTSAVPSDSEETSSITECPGRFSTWRLRCDARISKERLRRQLRRSKTHVEGHVCYPWLRRLFFHLSHYFPNLHTTRSTAPRTKLRGAANPVTATSSVIQSTTTSAKSQPLNPNGRRADCTMPVKRPSIAHVQTTRPSGNRSPYEELSPQISRHSGYESRRKSLSPKSHVNEEKIRVTSNRKRRPLQRQKISGTLDFDQFFAKSEGVSPENKILVTAPTAHLTSSIRETDRSDIFPGDSKPESFRQRNHDVLADISQESVNHQSNSGLDEQQQTLLITQSRSRSKTPSTRPPPPSLSPRNSGPRRSPAKPLQLQNSDSQASSSFEWSNLRNEMGDLYEAEENSATDSRAGLTQRNPQSRTLAPVTTRSIGPRASSSENRSLIQYRRVKARRNSSNSQAETGPPPLHFMSKDESANCTRGQDGPLSPSFLPLDAGLIEDRGAVSKHVETWLEETVNLTRLKQSRRRGNIYHICSGDASYEPPPAQVAQPRSFDSPVPLGLYESPNAYSLITSPRRVIQRQLHCSSQQSSDSPQLIMPSLTIDSNEGYPMYRMGESSEQDSRPSFGDPPYPLHPDDSNFPGTYRRHSENPISRNRQAPQNSMSIESATGISRTDSQPRAHGPAMIVGPGVGMPTTATAAVAAAPGTDQFLPTPNQGRERASSFQETGSSMRRKPPFGNELGTNSNQIRFATDRANLIKMTIIKQSRSFSSPRRGSRSPTIQSLREDSDLKPHPSAALHTPSKLLTRNPPSPLQQLGRQQMGTSLTGQCPYCPNCRPHCVRRRESQFSSGLPGQMFPEGGEILLKNPIASTFFERRYSHHLKPLDAWNSRQSHSMELVNTSHQSSRGLMSGGKQPLTSKLSLQRQVPQLYSRSMQQSTCSFPAQWCGFLSGPELSLTSPFDSASITPDSQKVRHFFEQSFDGVERVMTTTGRILDHTTHVHSASGSPGYPHVRNVRLDRYTRGSQDSRDQYMRSNMLCSSQALERNRDRRVNSFELNLTGDRGHNEAKRQSYLMLPNHYSSDSSRRGSALSNTSVRSAREFTPRIDERLDDNPLVPEPTVTSTPAFTAKLIPPDLIFSPASRRASIMDEQERASPDPSMPPMILNRNPNYADPIETADADSQLPYHEPVGIEQESENGAYAGVWSTEVTDQSPIHVRGHQSPLDPDTTFDLGVRCVGMHRSFNSAYPQNERNICLGGMRLPRGQRSQDYRSMEGLSVGPICTPLSHSHDDLRRSRSQFASASATTYPSSDCRPRFPDSHAYQALTRSLAPLVTTPAMPMRSSGRPMIAQNNGFRPLLGGSENRSAMSSCDQPVECLVPPEKSIRSPIRMRLNASTSDTGTTVNVAKSRKKRSVKGVLSDPVTQVEDTAHLNLQKCVRENYLFRSTSTGESSVDPKILEPSLCPVLDSSEENITDGTCEDDGSGHNRITSGGSKYSDVQRLQRPNETASTNQERCLPTSEHHAARRRSFLARYWQQAIQKSGEDSLDSLDTLRTETEG